MQCPFHTIVTMAYPLLLLLYIQWESVDGSKFVTTLIIPRQTNKTCIGTEGKGEERGGDEGGGGGGGGGGDS